MSFNKSKAEKSDGQLGRPGRSGSFGQHTGLSGSGKGGGAAPPQHSSSNRASLSSSRSSQKSGNVQGGYHRVNPANAGPGAGAAVPSSVVNQAFHNGAHLQAPTQELHSPAFFFRRGHLPGVFHRLSDLPVLDSYANLGVLTRHYAILHDLSTIQQRDRSIQEYVTELRALWRQLDSLEPSTCLTCACCQAHIQSRQTQRIFDFLMRLRPDYETVRNQLLNRDPIPSFDDVVRSVLVEEARLHTLSSPRPAPTDTVLAVTSSRSSRSSTPSSPSHFSFGSSSICRYCKRHGHIKTNCPKLQQRQLQLRAPQRAPTASSEPYVASVEALTPDTNDALASQAMQRKERKVEEDCYILEPDDCRSLATDLEHKVAISNDSEEDVCIISEKGQVACRDYPHPRHLCALYPFKSTNHENFCTQCYCYVCDERAPCDFWEGQQLSHCHASDKEHEWIALRAVCRDLKGKFEHS